VVRLRWGAGSGAVPTFAISLVNPALGRIWKTPTTSLLSVHGVIFLFAVCGQMLFEAMRQVCVVLGIRY
jgi:hypothetical protein